MKFDNYLIGILLFTLFIIVGVLVQTDVIANYDVNQTTDEFTSVYNTSNDMYLLGQNMKNETLDASIAGEDQSWESMTKGSYSAIRFLRDSFSIVADIMNAISTSIGLPIIFVTIGMTIVVIQLIFSIVYMIFRFKP